MNLLNKLLNPLEIIKTFTFFVDGGIGEAALAGEAVSGMDLAADAGLSGANAIGGGALATGVGSGATVSGMDLAADAGMGANNAIGSNALSNMPIGPGTPTGPAINAANAAVNEANVAAKAASPYALNGASTTLNSAGSMANTFPSLQNGSIANGLSSLQGNPSVLANAPSLADAYTTANPALGPGLGLNPALGQAGFNAGMANAATASASPFSSLGNMFSSAAQWASANPVKATALGGVAGIYALMKSGAMNPNYMTPYQPPSAASVGLGRTLSPQYKPTFAMAEGGVTSLAIGGTPGQQYPMSQINYNGYNTPTQMPTTAMQMAGYQPSNMPLQGALQQNMASGGSASSSQSTPSSVSSSSAPVSGITAAGLDTAPELNVWHPSASNNGSLQDLAAQYGVSLPSGMANQGVTSLASGGDTLTQIAGQQNSPIDPRTGVPYDQEQFNNPGFFGGLGESIDNLGRSIGKGLGFAHGGSAGGYNLGGYSDGGRLLKGPGDGMSDDIPASIAHKQPARLADGEFVVPADVVSHLGNGSTDAGAKHLYSMMDRVRKARTGNLKQGKQIKPEKYLPA